MSTHASKRAAKHEMLRTEGGSSHLVAVQQLLIKGLFNQDSQLVTVQVLHLN